MSKEVYENLMKKVKSNEKKFEKAQDRIKDVLDWLGDMIECSNYNLESGKDIFTYDEKFEFNKRKFDFGVEFKNLSEKVKEHLIKEREYLDKIKEETTEDSLNVFDANNFKLLEEIKDLLKNIVEYTNDLTEKYQNKINNYWVETLKKRIEFASFMLNDLYNNLANNNNQENKNKKR